MYDSQSRVTFKIAFTKPLLGPKIVSLNALSSSHFGLAAGKKESKQALLGKVIGWIFWKGFVGPKRFRRNGPSLPDLVVQGEPDFGPTKERLKTLLGEFHALGEQGCDGKYSRVFQKNDGCGMGVTQYKHMDHRLRQFGA